MTQQPNGFILLSLTLLISTCLIQVSFLTKSISLFNKTYEQNFYATKAFYLAQSGWTIAKHHLENLPSISATTSKEELYANLHSSYSVEISPKNKVHLFHIPSDNIIAIGVVETHSKKTIRFSYKIENSTPLITKWKLL